VKKYFYFWVSIIDDKVAGGVTAADLKEAHP
jgi:hypothetical protein